MRADLLARIMCEVAGTALSAGLPGSDPHALLKRAMQVRALGLRIFVQS